MGDYEVIRDEVESHLFEYTGSFGEDPPPDSPVYDRPWVVVYCPFSSFTDAPVLWGVEQVGERPDQRVMARVAEEAVVLPIPEPRFSPAADAAHVVGLETWLWLPESQTAPVTRTACIPPFAYACVEVSATFVDLRADMADGSVPLVCEGRGTAYDPGRSYEDQRNTPHCGHVYTRAPAAGDTYPAQVAATWHVTYSCSYDSDGDGVHDSVCDGGTLGLIARASDPQPLDVRDLQAVASQS